MSFPERVRGALTSHLTLVAALALAGCSKSEAAPDHKAPPRASAAAVAVERAPAASTSVAPAEQAPGPTSPATWPTTENLAFVRADQLLERIRSRGEKGTIINAWASWCGPCRAELPMLASLSKNLALQSIDVVLVSVDDPQDHEKAEAFLRSFEIRLPAYLAAPPLDAFKAGLNPRWPGMLPASFLYDSEPKLRYFWGGEAYESEIVSVVDAFLAGKLVETEAEFMLAPGTTAK